MILKQDDLEKKYNNIIHQIIAKLLEAISNDIDQNLVKKPWEINLESNIKIKFNCGNFLYFLHVQEIPSIFLQDLNKKIQKLIVKEYVKEGWKLFSVSFEKYKIFNEKIFYVEFSFKVNTKLDK